MTADGADASVLGMEDDRNDEAKKQPGQSRVGTSPLSIAAQMATTISSRLGSSEANLVWWRRSFAKISGSVHALGDISEITSRIHCLGIGVVDQPHDRDHVG